MGVAPIAREIPLRSSRNRHNAVRVRRCRHPADSEGRGRRLHGGHRGGGLRGSEPRGAAASTLPPPSFTAPGQLLALAAAGSRVAVANDCDIRLADLARGTKPIRIKRVGDCRSDPSESAVDDLYLGRTTLVAQVILAPSPHGESYSLWSGALPAGPLHPLGAAWGWTDSGVQMGYGCDWTVAAGGGSVALAKVPNRHAVDVGLTEKPACPAGAASHIMLKGASRAELTVPGSWTILATDGKRLALAQLDEAGLPTGKLSLVDVGGKPLPTPIVAEAAVKTAYHGWLTPEGLVLETTRGISGPGWTIRDKKVGSATVAEGRLLYVKRRTVRVRRLRDGIDRVLVTLPTSQALIAAGSFGLAVAVGANFEKATLYRLPWRTIDRTLPSR